MNSEQQIDLVKKLSGGVLTKEEILDRLETKDKSHRIFFTPMISKTEQIGSSGIDVRLGTQFILFRRTKYSVLDILESDPKDLNSKIGGYQEKVFTPVGDKLVLHPRQLVLGCTLEYIRIPNDLIAEVVGRSSWGRLGLIISAATLIHPGYAGVITLELVNAGEAPIALPPAMRIAQLVLHRLSNPGKLDEALFSSKYLGALEPTFSRLYEDGELPVIRKIGENKLY